MKLVFNPLTGNFDWVNDTSGLPGANQVLVFNPYTGSYEVLPLAAPPAWFFASALQMGAL